MFLLPSLPIFLLFIFSLLLFATLFRRKDGRKHPPGPPGLPVIGNLHMLGKLPHRDLGALAKRYGPIMYLRLGQVPTIVVSSSEAAEQFLKTHDGVFCGRSRIEATDYISYGSKGVAFTEYGPYWRTMRKLCAMQLLNSSKVESFAPLRMSELRIAVKSLEKAAMAREVVDLTNKVNSLLEEIVYKMVLGCSKDDEFDLKGLVQWGLNLSGAFNLADFVPWLGALNLQGLRQNFKEASNGIDQVLEKIIQRHEGASDVQGDRRHKDLTDVLLSLMDKPIDPSCDYDQRDNVIDRNNVKAILLDMIAGAFETGATAIMWALAELVRNPRVMKNLRDELEKVVGLNKMVEEADFSKLNYLDAVVNETLRLYPPGPLLPRASVEDAMVDGYFIEKKSRIMINAWAIGRDPKIWSDNAEVFYPERFLTNNNNSSYRGHDFHLVPFGYGRRGCPGMNLGITNIKLVVSQLVHCFSWELPPHTTPRDMDMSEKFGLTMPRAEHLLAIPTYRLNI